MAQPPVRNISVQPLQSVEQRIGDEFQPAKIHQRVQRRIHLLQVVVILGSHVNAQRQRLLPRRGHLRHRFLHIRRHPPERCETLSSTASPAFPAPLRSPAEKPPQNSGPPVSSPILAALPDTGRPLFRALEFLGGDIGQLPPFGRKHRHVSIGAGFDTVKSPNPPSHANPAVTGA